MIPRPLQKESGNSPPPLPSHHGFTLIELLIVIAIIAILAAILMPVAGTMRGQAQGTECVSRLRQATAALLMHAADHKNTINYKAGGSGGAQNLWTAYAASYLQPNRRANAAHKELDTLYCPSYAPFRHDPLNYNWQWDSYGGYYVPSSFVQRQTVEDENGKWTSHKVTLANLPSLSTYPILLDSVTPDLKKQRMNIISHTGSNSAVSVHMRHNGLANAAFYDGHVKALNAEALAKIGFTRGFDKELNPVNY